MLGVNHPRHRQLKLVATAFFHQAHVPQALTLLIHLLHLQVLVNATADR